MLQRNTVSITKKYHSLLLNIHFSSTFSNIATIIVLFQHVYIFEVGESMTLFELLQIF